MILDVVLETNSKTAGIGLELAVATDKALYNVTPLARWPAAL